MDNNSIMARIVGGIVIRIAGIGFALYVASYGVIALCDAIERVSAALPK